MKSKIEEQLEKGYSLDLGKVIDQSIEIYKKTFLISGLGYLLLIFVMIVLYSFLFLFIYGINDFADFAVEMKLDSTYLIGNFILSVVFASLTAPLNAGFLKICFLAKRNEPLNVSTIFDYYKGKYFKDIVIGSAIIALGTLILTGLFDFLALSFINIIVHIIFSLFTVLFLPIVIFGNQSFGKAIEKSIKLVAKQPIHIFVALLIAIVVIMLGLIGLCIGILFTLPFWPAMTFVLYDNIIGIEEEENIIDQIGSSEV